MKAILSHEDNIAEIQPNELLSGPAQQSYFSGLIAQLFDRSRRSLRTAVMFTSPHRKAGVSFICTGIAAELASRGEKVLLVDAHALLAVRTFSPRSVTALCKKVGPHHLWVLSMEETVGWSIDPKGRSSTVGALLRELERDFPYLLIDAPALSVAPDANLLATSVYGTVIVARTNQTREEQLKRTCQTLTTLGGRVLGSVFNAH